MKLPALYRFFRGEPVDLAYRTSRRSIIEWEQEYLYRRIIAADFPVRGVCEIGTFMGRTTIWLAAAAEERGARVLTVDIDEGASAYARAYVASAGLENVDFIVADSLDFARHPTPGSPNVWLIDGCHSKQHVLVEAKAAIRSCAGRGLIFFDNASDLHSDGREDGGVPAAVKELGARLIPETMGEIAELEVR